MMQWISKVALGATKVALGATVFVPLLASQSPVLDLAMVDVDGAVHRIGADPEPGPAALVFVDVGCPIARRYIPRLNELAERSAERKIAFYGVLSDGSLSWNDARTFRDDYQVSFPLLMDPNGTLAARLQPTRVPEAFVLDADDRLAYRGRIDNWFAAPTKPRAKATTHELQQAIDAVAAGRKPAVARSEPVGCEFEANLASVAGDVTWARHVAPILNAQCVECHRKGAVGPFALDTYAKAKRRARMIARVVEDGTMPPWNAHEGHGLFRDARVVSEQEKKVLRAWADAGAPQGDTSEAPAPPPPPAAGWPLGKPDREYVMPEAFSVPAEGDDIYRYFVVPMEMVQDRAVVAFDFEPGDAEVVHHCIAYVDYSGKARQLDAKDPKPGFEMFGNTAALERTLGDEMFAIGGWAPGSRPYRMPDGYGAQVPRGGDLIFEVHYHLTGKATKDQSKIALYFADQPVRRWVEGTVIGTLDVDIRPGEDRYWRHLSMRVPAGFELLDIGPHMHFLGEEVEVRATLPSGEVVPLLKADWDFRWQGVYVYRKPVHLPEGARIDAWFRFDNSADNVDNPQSPPKRVRWGWQTTDEMCELYLTLVPDDPDEMDRIQRAAEGTWIRSSRGRKGPPWRRAN